MLSFNKQQKQSNLPAIQNTLVNVEDRRTIQSFSFQNSQLPDIQHDIRFSLLVVDYGRLLRSDTRRTKHI